MLSDFEDEDEEASQELVAAKKQELSDAVHRPTKTGDNIKCYCIASY